MSEQVGNVGARIAELRKLRGATQRGLAMRASVSYSLLRKVETGDRPASHSFVAAVARALSVNVMDITEQPYGVRNATPSSEQAVVPPLRQALVEGNDPELDTGLRGLDELRVEVGAIKELGRRAKYAEAVRELPDVLRHLHQTVNVASVSQQPTAYELLAESYIYAVTALYRLGHLDLAHLADERARTAAYRGADPLLAATGEWNHALILLFDGSYPTAQRVITRGLEQVDLAPGQAPAASAVRGALHLRAAIIGARALDTDVAETHLVEAAAVARAGQEEANYYGTKFGLANVGLHRVAVPIELADGTTAVSRATDIRLEATTAPSRIGHYWIDLSRAWLLHGDRRKSLECLQNARRVAPQLTRYHPQVRETVHSLAVRDTRSTESLAHFAAWCGIQR